MVIIGLTGKARSGKDTAGEYLVENHKATLYALANPIRKAASEMFGLPYSDFTGDNPDREKVNEFWGFSPRQMLQMIGTEGGRMLFGNDIWLKRAEQQMMNLEPYASNGTLDRDYFVITDIRFENEAEWVRSKGGVVVHIRRDGIEPVNEHSSEDGVDVGDTDIVCHNTDTLEGFYKTIDVVMDIIKVRNK